MSKNLTRLPLLLALMVGCVPKLQPGAVREADARLPASYGLEDHDDSESPLPWRQDLFSDPHLQTLVDEALRNNQELLILGQRVQIANAHLIARRGAYLPRLRLVAGGGVEKVGRYTSQGASDHDDEIEPGRETPEALGDVHAMLQASWEVDIWGELRRKKRAAQMRYLASVEGRNFVVTQLVAEVAESYYELMALDRKLAVVEQNIDVLEETLDVVRLEREAGRETSLAVQLFEAHVLANEAERYELHQEIVEAENRLNLLCGRYPQHVDRSSDAFYDQQPVISAAGLPTQLLENRPDVRAAELTLAAAKLDVGAARAAFYPSLALDGNLGEEAFAVAKLGALPESILYDVFGSLTAPLFNRSELRAEYLAANAEQMEAVLEYERTVLKAYIEVVNQATRIGNLGESYDRRSRQVELLETAIDTSTVLFNSAHAEYLEVLTARSEALEAEMALVDTRRDQLMARVDLYRALGGGWEEPDATAP